MKHTVTTEQLDSYFKKETLASSYGMGDNKALFLFIGVLQGNLTYKYQVFSCEEILLETQALAKAIEKYNSI